MRSLNTRVANLCARLQKRRFFGAQNPSEVQNCARGCKSVAFLAYKIRARCKIVRAAANCRFFGVQYPSEVQICRFFDERGCVSILFCRDFADFSTSATD